MSRGKIIADGNIAEALSNDSVIKQANLVRPLLLALAIALKLKPPRNVAEAAKVLAR